MLNRMRLPLCIFLTTLIGACSTVPMPEKEAERRPTETEALLQQAAAANPATAARLRLTAAKTLIGQNQPLEALDLLAALDTTLLQPTSVNDVLLLQAQAAMMLGDRNLAQQALDKLPTAMLSPSQRTRADALQEQLLTDGGDPVSAARQMIAEAKAEQSPQRRQSIHNRLWRLLDRIDTATLEQLTNENNDFFEQGWFELALAVRSTGDISRDENALSQWRTLWESHPAYRLAPAGLSTQRGEKLAPRKIGLLLPFSGPLAEPARAISEGFFAASLRTTPANAPDIISLDSTLIDTPDKLFSAVQQEQIDLIIGPLARDYVERLSGISNPPVPILALNQSPTANPNLYQLDLASEQEATLLAQQANRSGYQRVAMIRPDAEWGARLARRLTTELEALGGAVSAELAYTADETLSGQIASLLLTDQSQARATEIRRVTGSRFEFDERPRDDIDAILIIALPSDARQIKPMLAFHFAGDLPVYATSHIYEGNPDAVRDVDLNGIYFLDLPWVILPPSPIHQSLTEKRTDADGRFGRLYALGIDAYQLHPYLKQLAEAPDAFLAAETGTLSIGANGRVHRKLPWARFNDGVPEPVNFTPAPEAPRTGETPSIN
ncbi:MAG: hypothetical protein CMI01_16035 [Oceanospirillaceae bacterium]|nr:hypothetical protein [Oceanospirillaceae bacterium]